MDRLRGMPEVETAALTSHLPLADERGIGFVVEAETRMSFIGRIMRWWMARIFRR